MTKIPHTTFTHVTSVTPHAQKSTLEELQDYFSKPEQVTHKTDASNLYSFVTYKEGAKRGTEGVTSVTGAVLDFDFKEPLEGHLRGKPYIENFLAIHNIAQWIHFWHTTYSFTSTQPNFRLILPFASDAPLSPMAAHECFARLKAHFNHPPALDQCGNTVAQLYFAPCIAEDKSPGTDFFAGSYIMPEGNYLNYKELKEAPTPTIYGTQENAEGLKNTFPTLDSAQKSTLYQQALRYVDPDLPYDQWIKMGMALRTELGESGYTIWAWWSQHGSKYKDDKDLRNHWKSFNSTQISGSTIVHYATEVGNGGTKFNLSECLAKYILPPKPTGSRGIAAVPLEEIELEDLPQEVFDENHTLKEWGPYTYNGNLFDLSKWPFLHALDEVFKANTIGRRHHTRLGSVLSVAGHLLPNKFGCPLETPLYTMILIPTCTGKGRFLRTITALMHHFDKDNHMCGRIGSSQGLVKKLIENNGLMYNLVDELEDYYLRCKSRGEANRIDILALLKEAYGGGQSIHSDLIKGEELEKITQSSISLCWFGVPRTFKLIKPQEFNGGFMNRILLFYEDCYGDTGSKSAEEDQMLRKLQIELPKEFLHQEFKYHFGSELIFPDGYWEYKSGLQELARSKMQELGEDNLRSAALGRVGEIFDKIAAMTSDFNGRVTMEGLEFAAGVVVMCLKTMSFCANKYFEIPTTIANGKLITERMKQLFQQSNNQSITQRDLYRSLQKLERSSIEESLKRLKIEGLIEMKEVQVGGSVSTIITPKARLNELFASNPQK